MDKNDLKQIGELIETNNKVLMGLVDTKFETNNKVLIGLVDTKFETNNKVLIGLIDVKLDNLEKKIEENFDAKMLEWKSEIVNSVDVLTKEIRDEREFREIASHQIATNSKKVANLEKKVFGSVQNDV